MEKITKTMPIGTKVDYKLVREKGFFTSHIWVWRNDKPYLHIMPGKDGCSKVSENVEGHGYMPMGEISVNFDDITLSNISLS